MSQYVLLVICLVALLLNSRFGEISGTNVCGSAEIIDEQSGPQTVRGAWPFLAALYNTERSVFFCGGTLITERNVLTAAHCIQKKNSQNTLSHRVVTVLLGAYNLNVRIEKGSAQVDVQEIHIHPDWNPFSEKYHADVAVLVLSETIQFTKYIRPICLPDYSPPMDIIGSTVGWGLSDDNTKRHESIPLLSNAKILNETYCYTNQQFLATHVTELSLCAGVETGSPNKGDSGGGLFYLNGTTWIQYGIISASLTGDAEPSSFTLYTNTTAYTNWTESIVGQTGTTVMTKDNRINRPTELWCYYDVLPVKRYKCSIWDSNVTITNAEVSKFTGDNLNGYKLKDAIEFCFWSGKVRYIPDGIGRMLPLLEKFCVGYPDRNMQLKLLKRSNFQDMELVYHLDVYQNDIEGVAEDTLYDLPNLKYFLIGSNKLRFFSRQTFKKSFFLTHVNASSNRLEYLQEDLFENNALLEVVVMENNTLTTIGFDVKHFKFLQLADFRKNPCIDDLFNKTAESSNLAELQAHLLSQCSVGQV